MYKSLEAVNKELEEQSLAHPRQQRTSTQVEKEKPRDDAIDTLADLREDLNRASSRVQIQSYTIEGLRRQTAIETATREASITKHQRGKYKSQRS